MTTHHARANGTTYYVDQDEGSDSNDGLAPYDQNGHGPWASIAKVNGFAFQPGDTIRFEDGETWNDSGNNAYYLDPCYDLSTKVGCSGSSTPTGDGQITLTHYCDVDCQLATPVFNGNGDGATIQLSDQQWWVISKLTVTNAPSGCTPPNCANYTRRGILVQADNAGNSKVTYQHIYVSDVTVYNVVGYDANIGNNRDAAKRTGGIVYYSTNENGSESSPAVFDDIQVTGNLVHDVYYEGIILTSDWTGAINSQPCNLGNGAAYQPSSNELVDGNTVYNVGGNGITVHVSQGISQGSVISNNVVHDGGLSGDLAEGIASLDNLNAVIKHNQVYNWQFHEADKGQYPDTVPFDVDDCDYGTTVEYNYSHDNQGGFMTIEPDAVKAIVRYNISERDGYGDPNQERTGDGIGAILKLANKSQSQLGDAGQGWMVYNNTFYLDDPNDKGPGTTLLNFALDPATPLNPAPVFENNLIENLQAGSNDTYTSCSSDTFNPGSGGTAWTLDYNGFYSTLTPGGCPNTPSQNDAITGDPGFQSAGMGYPADGDNNSDWQQDAASAYGLTNSNAECKGAIIEASGDDRVDFSGIGIPRVNAVDAGALEHSTLCP